MNKATLGILTVVIVVVSLGVVLFQSGKQVPPQQLEAPITFTNNDTDSIDNAISEPLQQQERPLEIAANSKPTTPSKKATPKVNNNLIEQELPPPSLERGRCKCDLH